MSKSNMNTITAFLLIAIVISVGVVMGSTSLSSERTTIYYDWDTNTDLSLDSGVTIFTANDTEYKSVKFDSDYNFSANGDLKDYRLIFDEELNTTDINEFTIEYKFSYEVNSTALYKSNFEFALLESSIIKNSYNDSLLNLRNYCIANGDDETDIVFGQDWFIGQGNSYFDKFQGQGFNVEREESGIVDTIIKYKVNLDDNYIVMYITKDDEEPVVTWSSLDDTNIDTENFDVNELVFGVFSANEYGYDNTLLNDDTFTIDYLKLTYTNPVTEE